jgi:hypothetical protein
MADDVLNNPLNLTPEMRKELENLEAMIARGKAGIETLKKIGLDTTDLEEKLDWSINTRQVLLDQFKE